MATRSRVKKVLLILFVLVGAAIPLKMVVNYCLVTFRGDRASW